MYISLTLKGLTLLNSDPCKEHNKFDCINVNTKTSQEKVAYERHFQDTSSLLCKKYTTKSVKAVNTVLKLYLNISPYFLRHDSKKKVNYNHSKTESQVTK